MGIIVSPWTAIEVGDVHLTPSPNPQRSLRARLRQRAEEARYGDAPTARQLRLVLPTESPVPNLSPLPARDPLAAWDAELTPRLDGVSLVGEINVGREEHDRLTADIAAHVARRRGDAGLHELGERYPAALATFLVFGGVFEYKAGNYWSSIAERLNATLAGGASSILGRAFEEFLRTRRLEMFPAFEHNALRYVSRILCHGGIPDYSLDDFFDLLAYSLRRAEWSGLTTSELIAEWRARGFGSLQLDRPVQRFVLYGGDPAADFLQRSLDMLERALDSGIAGDAGETGLPFRVGDAFQAWFARHSATAGATPVARHGRAAAPRVRLDPWAGSGPHAELPRQITSDRRMVWTIVAGQQAQQFEGGDAVEFPLPGPVATWRVGLDSDGREIGSWQFPGLTTRQPLLAFKEDSGELLRSTNGLAAGGMWLLWPRAHEATVVVNSDEQPLPIKEVFPPLHGAWRDFRAAWVELQPGTLRLRDGDNAISIPVRAVSERAGQPRVEWGSARVDGIYAGDDGMPILASPPELIIPREPDAPPEPARWTIVVTPRDGSRPAERVTRPVSELAWSELSGALSVPLAQRALLSEDAFGTFAVVARGPLGRDARFEFALAPGLTVRGHATSEAIERTSTTSANVRIVADVPLRASLIAGDAIIEQRPGEVRLQTRDRLLALGLGPADTRTAAPALELRIPIAGVRWAVSGLDGALRWSADQAVIPRDALDGRQVGILVEGYGDAPGGTAWLTLETGQRQLQRAVPVVIRGPRVFLPLDGFASTIASSADAALLLSLDVRRADGGAVVTQRGVARITRALEAHDLVVTDDLTDDGCRRVRAGWAQRWPVNGRELRLWSVARPWEAPARVTVLDDAGNAIEFERTLDELPPGPYAAGLVVVDPWLGPDAADDTVARRHAASVQLGTRRELDDRLDHLNGSATGKLERFQLTRDARSLAGLDEALAGEAAAPALAVFDALTATDDANVLDDERMLKLAAAELRRALLRHPGLFPELASRAAGQRAMLPRLLAALGVAQARPALVAERLLDLADAERTALEHQAPLLFLCRVGGAWAVDAERRSEAESLFGNEALGRIRRHEDADVIAAHRFTPEPVVTAMPTVRLQALREQFGPVPRELLDESAVFAALLDTLIILNDPQAGDRASRVGEWLSDAAPRIEAALDHLRHAAPEHAGDGWPLAYRLVNARFAGAENGLNRLPVVVGGLALLQRLRARRPHWRNELRLGEELLLEYGRQAQMVIPALYQHDLCLFDLLLTRPAEPVADNDVEFDE